MPDVSGDIGAGLSAPSVDVDVPSVDVPSVDVDVPSVDVPSVGVDVPSASGSLGKLGVQQDGLDDCAYISVFRVLLIESSVPFWNRSYFIGVCVNAERKVHISVRKGCELSVVYG